MTSEQCLDGRTTKPSRRIGPNGMVAAAYRRSHRRPPRDGGAISQSQSGIEVRKSGGWSKRASPDSKPARIRR